MPDAIRATPGLGSDTLHPLTAAQKPSLGYTRVAGVFWAHRMSPADRIIGVCIVRAVDATSPILETRAGEVGTDEEDSYTRDHGREYLLEDLRGIFFRRCNIQRDSETDERRGEDALASGAHPSAPVRNALEGRAGQV